MIPQFSFTRVPSTKVSTAIQLSGLISAANTLVIMGRLGASGASVNAGVPTVINNYGDPVAAATECAGYFGASSEAGSMVVAAINGILYSDLAIKGYPPIIVIPMANGAPSSQFSAVLAGMLNQAAPYLVSPYDASDTVALAALQSYAAAISGADRGLNGQFGTFGFAATGVPTAQATPLGISTASNNICIPWLRDSNISNQSANVAAAYAAVCASLGVPYLPLNGVRVGGIVPPFNPADWHTPGDAGTVQLGLAAGLTPLQVQGSNVVISRSITTQRTVSTAADNAYYDMQDWQKIFYYRQNAYNTAVQPTYARAAATDQKLLALRSELIELMDTFEDLEMFQYVQKFLGDFSVYRQPGNRFAGLYNLPFNVVPGFMNKGLALVGTEQYDSFVIA